MTILTALARSLLDTLWDILPILVVIGFFQLVVLRRPIPNVPRVALGFGLVAAGMGIFLVGLRVALLPLGDAMANQLAAPDFVLGANGPRPETIAWYRYYWTYLFAFCIGFSAAIAEPTLLAVAIKAREASGGAIGVWGLRIAVGLGSGLGVALGAFRIVAGIPLPYLVMSGYLIVIVQTYFAPKTIVPLAYDSGVVTTSTVTVPLVTALGLGLAANIPGRHPLSDGFGMIILAILFPMITVMGYAQLAQWRNRRKALQKVVEAADES